MLRWIRRKVELAAVKGATEDIERLIAMLEGAEDSEIGILLASATFSRILMLRDGLVPSGAFNMKEPRDEEGCDFFPLRLNKLISHKQKQEEKAYGDVAGLMILLHSARAINMPEIRSHGRKMWKELSRGMHYASVYLPNLFEAEGGKWTYDDVQSAYFIPPGLEPRI